MAGIAVPDWRQMGHAIRRRMGAPSSTLQAAVPASQAWQDEDQRLLDQENARLAETTAPTYNGQRRNLRRLGGQ